VFSIKRKGIPRLHGGGRGDLLVRAELKVPTDLSDEQRELMHQLAESLGTPVGVDKGLLTKLKDALG
jgi:molecular chaperone DnaJ